MTELIVGSKPEKLNKKRKSIPKEETAAIKGPVLALTHFDVAKRGRDVLTILCLFSWEFHPPDFSPH